MSFLDFAQQHGLQIRRLVADGRIHRCPTVNKPRSDNGAYMIEGDRGWLMDWSQGDSVIWWHDPTAKPWTAEQKAAAERKRKEAAQERARLALKAANDAQRMLSEAEWLKPTAGRVVGVMKRVVGAVPGHPYLERKGFPLEPCFVREGELLIPMFDCFHYKQPIGLQRIKPDGDKKFLTGQRSKGAVYRMGTGQGSEQWLVEGYATALSLRLALKRLYRNADIYVCFSAGNIGHIASVGIGTHVMADNDASKAGEETAAATGLCWTMPAETGMDANDLHVRDGIEAVCKLVQRRL